jgi:hypothetical protein
MKHMKSTKNVKIILLSQYTGQKSNNKISKLNSTNRKIANRQ